MKTILSLAVPLGLLFVSCWANQQDFQSLEKGILDFQSLEKGIQSLSDGAVRFESEFNNGLKLKELESAINVVDRGLLGFRGTAKKNLDRIRTLTSNSRLAYKGAAGSVFEWCVAAKATLDLYINTSSSSLPEKDKNALWNMVLTAVKSGLTKVSDSFKQLESVKQQREDLVRDLQEMNRDLTEDLGPDGYFELENKHQIEDDKAWLQALRSEILLQSSTRNITQFGNEATTCLSQAFTNVPEVRQTQLQDKKDIYSPLAGKIKAAIQLSATPDFKLKDNSISNLLQALDNNPMLLENDYASQGRLLPLLKTLFENCEALIKKTSPQNA